MSDVFTRHRPDTPWQGHKCTGDVHGVLYPELKVRWPILDGPKNVDEEAKWNKHREPERPESSLSTPTQKEGPEFEDLLSTYKTSDERWEQHQNKRAPRDSLEILRYRIKAKLGPVLSYHETFPERFEQHRRDQDVHKPLKALSLSEKDEQEFEDLPSSSVTFRAQWIRHKTLGRGGDGIVFLGKPLDPQGKCVAVKVPLKDSGSARSDLAREVKNFRILGRHDHVLELWHVYEDWPPIGPALVLPVCDLGDLITYREDWCAQQLRKRKPKCVSELTMWKLFKDMSLALDHIHNGLKVRYVHNDFKPGNILVVTPPGYNGDGLPEEPIFKISDFARLTPWPTPKGEKVQGFGGTSEFAPPYDERIAPVRTPVDIWGLGATLQYMALGVLPICTRETFIERRKAKSLTYPELEDEEAWHSSFWRRRRPTTFRPIDVPMSVLQRQYDFKHPIAGYKPFGKELGHWYRELWEPKSRRPSSMKLARTVVPLMDKEIARIKALPPV